MKKLALTTFFLYFIGGALFSQSIPTDSLYLGQTPPGNTPIVFNLPVTTGLRPVERITVSSDGKEIYYSEIDYWPGTIKRIQCFKYIGNAWQGPTLAFEGYSCPALSTDDSVMYMQTEVTLNSQSVATTFSAKRNATGWDTPVRLLSTNLQTHYFQNTQSGNQYLASTPSGNSDLCKLICTNSDTILQSLGKPINTSATENDFFIARDESYIIVFRLSTPYNLFVSFNKGDGTWTNPKAFGANINTSIYDCSPFVTNDNKYLFFTRGGNSMPTYSTYWVNIEGVIDSLRNSNYSPYLASIIPDQTDTVGQLFNYTIPTNTFIDDDGNQTLTLSAKLFNGNPLPAWLAFDSITHVFTGTPTSVETLNIKVTATDTAGAAVSTTFKIFVKSPAAIDETSRFGIKITPNPTSGLIKITLGSLSENTATAEIRNIEGKLIQSETFSNELNLDLSNQPKGIYLLKLIIDNKVFIQKICLK